MNKLSPEIPEIVYFTRTNQPSSKTSTISACSSNFRTSYLRLGDNARNYCVAKERKHLPFFALTATASYDVLSDIQRETMGKNGRIKVIKEFEKSIDFELGGTESEITIIQN